MAAKKKTPTASPSTFVPAPARAAASSAVSTSANAASVTPPTEPMPSVAKTALADVQAWVDRNVSAGAPACLAVLGISSGNLAVTLPEGKRAVSLPPGDVLVIVLPPGAGRQAGVFLAEANA